MKFWEASEGQPKKLQPFRLRYSPGHNATDSKRWANATAPYDAIYEEWYEPWGIMHR